MTTTPVLPTMKPLLPTKPRFAVETSPFSPMNAYTPSAILCGWSNSWANSAVGAIAIAGRATSRTRCKKAFIALTLNDAGTGGKPVARFCSNMRSMKLWYTILGGLCLAAATGVPAREPSPALALDVSEIAPGNYVHYGSFDERSPDNLGDNANIGFIVGEKCVL